MKRTGLGLCLVMAAAVISVSCEEKGGGTGGSSFGSSDIVASLPKMGEDGLDFVWSSGDKVAVISESEGTQSLTLKDGAKTSSASFAGAGLVGGSRYSMVYPYSSVSSGEAKIRYSGLKITSNGATDHLKGPFWASATATPEGGASFSLSHTSSVIGLKLSNPVNTKYEQLEIIPLLSSAVQSATLDVADGKLSSGETAASQSVALSGVETSSKSKDMTLWVPYYPSDLSSDALAVVLSDTYGLYYTSRLEGKNLAGGKAYVYSKDLKQWTKDGESGFKVTKNPQVNISKLGVPYGQYSGITKVSETRYAVAHDKLKGAGFQYFDMSFDEKGNVRSISIETPSGVTKATENRDAEGVAFNPQDKTIFVCGELDRKIKEYDQDGVPTGREVVIPDDILHDIQHFNRGMESLAFSQGTGLLWSCTETPMVKDVDCLKDAGVLMRLQSFDKALNPAGRYLYLMDLPESKDKVTDDNQVHGIADLMALDDGRLVVLEREVYVNTAALSAWARIKLYVVDPAHDTGGVLSKSLLADFKEELTSLADYEGLCYGPTLADGSRTILLICDSQGGRSFQSIRLPDFIKTIVLK